MTKEEALKVLEIMTTADGGCYICASDLFEEFVKAFPQFFKLAEDFYLKEKGYDKFALHDEAYESLKKEVKNGMV